jgi:hypothetical protein
MMNKKTITVMSLMGLCSLGNVLCASSAWAWGGHGYADHDRHGYHGRSFYHSRYPFGRIDVSLPRGAVRIGFNGRHYNFHSGWFYQRRGREYVVVPPPYGAVVYAIPAGWNTALINGVMYYTYGGVYYVRTPRGYQVVEPPRQVLAEPVPVAVYEQPPADPQEYTVNIPRHSGGYVSVVIKRAGTKFTGPQGEIYEEFPRVDQLAAMYAR